MMWEVTRSWRGGEGGVIANSDGDLRRWPWLMALRDVAVFNLTRHIAKKGRIWRCKGEPKDFPVTTTSRKSPIYAWEAFYWIQWVDLGRSFNCNVWQRAWAMGCFADWVEIKIRRYPNRSRIKRYLFGHFEYFELALHPLFIFSENFIRSTKFIWLPQVGGSWRQHTLRGEWVIIKIKELTLNRHTPVFI